MELQGNGIDTYSEIPFVKFAEYSKYLPGSYIREYRGKKFPVYINKLGFRGQEIALDKKDDLYRIIILGGSCVLGLESPDNATIPFILQNEINHNKNSYLKRIGKDRAEVINTGVIGNASVTILTIFNKELLRLKPDCIIIYSAFNDYRYAGVFDSAGTFGNNFVRRLLGKTWAWFYNHSLFFATAYEKFNLFPKKTISLQLAEEVFGQYERTIKAIIQTAYKNNIKPVLVKEPLFIEGMPRLQDRRTVDEIENKIKNDAKITYDEAYYWMQSRQLDALDRLSAQYNVLLVDPMPEMDRLNKKELFHDIVHLKEAGNHFLAGLIFKKLAEDVGRNANIIEPGK